MKTVMQEVELEFESRSMDGFYVWYFENKNRLMQLERLQLDSAYYADKTFIDEDGNEKYKSSDKFYEEKFTNN